MNPDEETATALYSFITMVEMSGSEFLAMDDVNVRLTGYLADVEEYGEDVSAAWAAIGE